MKTERALEPLKRASFRYPCPICGKTDWCGFNSHIAICMRIPSNYPVKNGGWLHKLSAPVFSVEEHFIKKPDPTVPVAPILQRDAVYRDFLSLLDLSVDHQKELIEHRKLSKRAIKKFGFRTVAEQNVRWQIAQKLMERGHELKGIPGFYRVPSKRGGFYWTFSMKPGFVFPILDKNGAIQALQTRLDKPDHYGKYRLFSSSKKESGSCSGVPVHVARTEKKTSQAIWITEGPLKSTIASQYLGAVVLGLVSVNTWLPAIELLKNFKGEIIVAFDQDQDRNIWVARAAKELTKALAQQGHYVRKAIWNGSKGIDEAVSSGEKILLKGDE